MKIASFGILIIKKTDRMLSVQK